MAKYIINRTEYYSLEIEATDADEAWDHFMAMEEPDFQYIDTDDELTLAE